MQTLEQINKISFVLFSFLVILLVLGFIVNLIVTIIFKRKKSEFKAKELLRNILDDNKLTDTNIGSVKFIRKSKNYNSFSNVITIRQRDESDTSIVKIYDMLFHVLNLYEIKDRSSRRILWLKILSCLIWISLCLYIVTLVLYLCVYFDKIDDSNILQGIMVFTALSGVILILISWLSWTYIQESFRVEILELAEDYLEYQSWRNIKKLSLLKAIFPLSEELLFKH